MESVSLDWLLMGESKSLIQVQGKIHKSIEKDNERLVNENQMLMNVMNDYLKDR